MMDREYTWSSIFAWGLTLSGATLATAGVIGMFWPQLDIVWVCVAAFAGMMAFGIGLVNCSAAGALQAIKHCKPNGRRVDWAVLVPALACCVGFAFATNIGVHFGWEMLKANAPADARLPPAAIVDAVFYVFAFAKPAMAWIVEGRKTMDAEDFAARQALRRREAADMAAAEIALEAARTETARASIATAEPAATATSETAEPKPRAPRRPKTEEELREAARRAVARRAAAFRDQNMTTHVRAVDLPPKDTPVTPQLIASTADGLLERGEKPSLPRIAELMGVTEERIEQTWPKGVPLDGTGKIRAA
ncbi:MAG TPA: hypothetical protein VIA80_10090 [Hyphomonadaceae bacterium]